MSKLIFGKHYTWTSNGVKYSGVFMNDYDPITGHPIFYSPNNGEKWVIPADDVELKGKKGKN